jgi:hypothetical protein
MEWGEVGKLMEIRICIWHENLIIGEIWILTVALLEKGAFI